MMQGEKPEDARTVWQHQPAERSGITPEMLREKTRALRVKTRKELLGNGGLALITIGFGIHGILHTRERGWQIALALAVAWALIGQYISGRGTWPGRSPVRSAPSAGLSFYRHELKRRHDLFRRFIGWSFGPVVLAMGSWILAMSHLARKLHLTVNFVPLCTLAALWAIGVLALRLRTRRELKRELDELAAIERQNQ